LLKNKNKTLLALEIIKPAATGDFRVDLQMEMHIDSLNSPNFPSLQIAPPKPQPPSNPTAVRYWGNRNRREREKRDSSTYSSSSHHWQLASKHHHSPCIIGYRY
jgi:hypothetical protein